MVACVWNTAFRRAGLIGFQSEFMTMTRGTGIMAHVFDDYAPVKAEMPGRRNGVLISAEQGEAVAYALWKLEDRGRMFVSPGDKLYEGMIIGIHSRDNDLVVNPIKGKQLTNVRASGTDEAVRLTPPVRLTLESAVEFIDDDELVEITPLSIRVRKRFLTENERKARDAACNSFAMMQRKGMPRHPFHLRQLIGLYWHEVISGTNIHGAPRQHSRSLLAGLLAGAAIIWLVLRERTASAGMSANSESRVDIARLNERLIAAQDENNRLTTETANLAFTTRPT